jgi:hypothetical protein
MVQCTKDIKELSNPPIPQNKIELILMLTNRLYGGYTTRSNEQNKSLRLDTSYKKILYRKVQWKNETYRSTKL